MIINSSKLFSTKIFRKFAVETLKMSTQEDLPFSPDYFHEVGYYETSVTSLIPGAPGKKILAQCADIFLKATQHRLQDEKQNGHLFQYGPTRGDWHYINNLAKFLSKKYNKDVSMKSLLTNGGASHGLYYTASLFFKKGATVFVEDPTYFIAFLALRDDLGLNVVPVALDSEGIKLDDLEENVKKYIHLDAVEGNDMFDGMLYIIPAHQNPTGLCYSEERSKEVVKLARKYNLLVFCDDVYNILSYSCSAIPPLFYYDDVSDPEYKGNVISNCTFSKLLGPGLRLGWIQSSENILNKFIASGVMKSGGCPNNYTAGILASVMELGLLDDIVSSLLHDYKNRLSTVCHILKENLPNGCSFREPDGGFFVWIVLPPEVDGVKLVAYTKEHYSVSVMSGNRCSVKGNFQNCLRLSFTLHEEKIVFDSVLRLCNGIKEYLKLE